MLSLNNRQKEILRCLIESSEEVSGLLLSKTCSISTQTLRREIDILNDYLISFGCSIVSKHANGYLMNVEDSIKFDGLKKDLTFDLRRNRYFHYDDNYRAFIIIRSMLTSDDYFKIESLCDMFNCSRSIINEDIKKVKEILSDFNILVLSKPKYGLYLEGPELYKRLCLIFQNKYFRRLSEKEKNKEMRFLDLFSCSLDCQYELERILSEALNEYKKYVLPRLYCKKVLDYLLISLKRSHKYNRLNFEAEQIESIKNSMYFKMSEKIYKRFDIFTQNKSGFLDIIGLAFLLANYRTISSKNQVADIVYEENLSYVNEIISQVSRVFDISSIFDEKFREEFCCYLIRLKERYKYNHLIPADKEIIYAVKKDGAFCIDLCFEFALYYYRKFGVRLRESDILESYYIFSSAMLRNEYKRKLKILSISLFGIHYAMNIATRIKQIYYNEILNIDVIEHCELDSMDLNNYDLIITDMKQTSFMFTEIPTIQIDFFRDRCQTSNLEKYFNNRLIIEAKKIFFKYGAIKHCNFTNKLEAFRFISTQLEDKQDGQQNIYEDLYKRDCCITSERINRIALVSFGEIDAGETKLMLLLNKRAFLWDKEQVQLVVFYNYRNMNFNNIYVIKLLIIKLLHSDVLLLDKLADLGYSDFLQYIINKEDNYDLIP